MIVLNNWNYFYFWKIETKSFCQWFNQSKFSWSFDSVFASTSTASSFSSPSTTKLVSKWVINFWRRPPPSSKVLKDLTFFVFQNYFIQKNNFEHKKILSNLFFTFFDQEKLKLLIREDAAPHQRPNKLAYPMINSPRFWWHLNLNNFKTSKLKKRF